MNNNVFCIGELLIDMVCVDNKGLKNGEKFEKKSRWSTSKCSGEYL